MDDLYINKFARRLCELRQKKKVSARAMSLDLGQNHNYINNIESEKNYPSMRLFFYICEYLDIEPRAFFNFGGEEATQEEAFLEQFQKLDEKSREYIYHLMKDIENRPE